MRVAIIGPSPRFLSGVSYFTMRLSNALSELMGVKTILFRNMLPKRLFPGWKRVGKTLTNLHYSDRVYVIELMDWYNPLTWIKAYKMTRNVDAVILQWWTSSVAHVYLFIELLNRKKVPIVIEFHEVVDPLESSIMPIRVYSKIMAGFIRKLATNYVVHSESDKSLISKSYGIEEDRIQIVYHGIYDHYKVHKKDEIRGKLGIGDEEFVILFFGLLRPYKGVKYLVKAYEKLPEDIRKGSRLLIVGETWEDTETENLVRNSECRNRIKMVSKYVGDEEVSEFFSAADVLAIPYTRASQSGVAHIGMAYGLPIIASRVGGLVESLGKYQGALFTEPKDIDTLRDALISVMSKNSKDKDKSKFKPPDELRWENIAKDWSDYLRELVVKKRDK